MKRTTINTAVQASLFAETTEVVITRDAPFEDGTRVVRPSGDGWLIADFTHEKRTMWFRTRLVPAWVRR
jgi:hypothetical protein